MQRTSFCCCCRLELQRKELLIRFLLDEEKEERKTEDRSGWCKFWIRVVKITELFSMQQTNKKIMEENAIFLNMSPGVRFSDVPYKLINYKGNLSL